jgi:hypothetical protein
MAGKPEYSDMRQMTGPPHRISNPVQNDMPEFAIRDPAVAFNNGVFYVYHTYVDFRGIYDGYEGVEGVHHGRIYISTHLRTTEDLVGWSNTREVFGGPNHYSSPGNVFRHPVDGRWTICIQSYPFPPGRDTGDESCRLFLSHSDDLENWSEPQVMVAEGACHNYNDSPRQIDPFVVLDGDRAWCFYKTVGELGLIVSDDGLQTWREALTDRPAIGRGHMPTGETVENPYVLRHANKWWMFLSPCSAPRKIGWTCSEDITEWPPVTYLDFPDLPWAPHGPTAPAIVDMRDESIGAWVMLFHGDTERRTGHEAALGVALSDDLVNWRPPGRGRKERRL